MTGFDKGAEKLELLCTVGENVKMAQLLWKTVWQVLKKLNMEFSYDNTSEYISPKVLKAETRIPVLPCS